jgi:hypothetical protein
MTETFMGADLLGHVEVPALPLWRVCVTRRGRVIMSTGSGDLTPAEARKLARAVHKAARLAEGEKEQKP